MRLRKQHLWWLLAPVVVPLLLVGLQIWDCYRQQMAIHNIENLGGRVVTTHGEPVWIRRLIGGHSLGLFEQATIVNLSQSEVTDADLVCLQRLNGLQRLNLSGTRVTDHGLRHLKRLTGLKALDLSGTAISGQGLEHLHMLTALEYLYLGDTEIEDADLHHLNGLTRLRHLDVRGSAVSNEGVEEIQKVLPELEVSGSFSPG